MKKLILFMLLCCLTKIEAQQNTLASGGNVTGTGGSVSFSIGQVDYVTQTGSNGSAGQGVQQPFEITMLSGSDFTNISINAVAYPNPTVSNLTIVVKNYDLSNLTYQLYDISGKSISKGKITTEETFLDIQQYAPAVYVLELLSDKKEIKTFKVIKN